jgi:hypothetical protein
MGQNLSLVKIEIAGTIVLLLLVLCVTASDPMAEDRAASRVNIYTDNDRTTVISPMIILQKDIYDKTSLNVQYIADIESCASVDVVSTASPVSSKKGYQETRHNISASVSHRKSLTTLGAGYYYSTENDYTSNAVSASFSQELFQRNFTIDFSLSYRWDTVGRVKDEYFSKSLNGVDVNLSLTQVLSPRMIGQLVYFVEYLDGYQSSPYRVVPVADFSVPETHPSRRIRHSFTGRLKESLSDRWSLEQSLRFYTDSWGVNAWTILSQLYYQISDPLSARVRYRFYTQDRADFYKESYQSLQEFVSRDRELATFQTHLMGPQLILELNDLWIFPKAEVDLKMDYFYIQYEDFALLKHREGFLIGTGFDFLY